jgi:hypothetical protein
VEDKECVHNFWSGNTWELFTLRTVTNGIIELRWLLRRKTVSNTGGWKTLQGTTKQLQYLVMPKIQFMPFDNHKE